MILQLALFFYHVLDKYYSIQNQKELKELVCVFLKIRCSLIITMFLGMLYIINKYILEYTLYIFYFDYFSLPIPATPFPSQLYIFLLRTHGIYLVVPMCKWV